MFFSFFYIKMGKKLSLLWKKLSKHSNNSSRSGISKLPEDCITNILSFTSPRDACHLSLVSSTFKSAADSNIVWEKFLPSDYHHIISKLVVPLNSNNFSSKKELYSHLCDCPILLQGGTKSLRLIKHSGKKCLMIGVRELTFMYVPKYRQWTSEYDSRFQEVVELSSMCFFEISGKVDTGIISPNTTYVVYLVIRFTNKRIGYGIECLPAVVSIKFKLGGECSTSNRNHGVSFKTVYLRGPDTKDVEFPRKRGDMWMEFEMGEFYNDEQGQYEEVEMTLREVEGLHWKYGIIVQGIEFRPKGEI